MMNLKKNSSRRQIRIRRNLLLMIILRRMIFLITVFRRKTTAKTKINEPRSHFRLDSLFMNILNLS